MNNQEARKYLKKILEIANSRDCCDVEIDAFYEEAIESGIRALGTIEQFRWERDVAIQQLKDLGIQFGAKTDDMRVINVNELAENIEDKMTYMCGCRNCIETVTQIIKGERKPFDNKCSECGNYKDCKDK